LRNYSFDVLNDKEFENFVNDLLSSHLGIRVESYKSGRDKGIDGRAKLLDGDLIVQSKHWVRSSLSKLKTELKKTEAEKVRRLEPKRYVLVTSLPLSYSDKKEIKDIFNPYINDIEDVLGREDLNQILTKNSDVEKNYHKLWLSSVDVLNSFFNSGLIGRSRFFLEGVAEKAKRFVETDDYRKALTHLKAEHVIIITGEPGIGKTTMAEHLSLKLVHEGFDFFQIDESISEVEGIYETGKKQVFYFDDFLGGNYLKSIKSNSDASIVRFIARVAKDSSKRFILTSRVTILNSAVNVSVRLEDGRIVRNKFELEVAELSDYDKAKILYNHIWFGGLRPEFKEKILENKNYLKIITHPNFNPRLIEFITEPMRVNEYDPWEYWSYVLELLKSPKEIWRKVIEVQIDESSRFILACIVYSGGLINETILKGAYSRMGRVGFSNNRSFNSFISTMVGGVINKEIGHNEITNYTLFNPSISDYMLHEYSDDLEYVGKIYSCVKTEVSLNNLHNPSFRKYISGDAQNLIIRRLVDDFIAEFRSKIMPGLSRYHLSLLRKSYFMYKEIKYKDFISELVVWLFENGLAYDNYNYVWLLIQYVKLNKDNFDCDLIMFSLQQLLNYDLDDYQFIVGLSQLAYNVEEHLRDGEIDQIKEAAIEYVSGNFEQIYLDEVDFSDCFEDEGECSDRVDSYIHELFSELYFSVDAVSINSAIGYFDYNSILESHSDEGYMSHYHYSGDKSSETEECSEIDDLFSQ
jgi:DNA polymerase III delta prime subunit